MRMVNETKDVKNIKLLELTCTFAICLRGYQLLMIRPLPLPSYISLQDNYHYEKLIPASSGPFLFPNFVFIIIFHPPRSSRSDEAARTNQAGAR